MRSRCLLRGAGPGFKSTGRRPRALGNNYLKLFALSEEVQSEEVQSEEVQSEEVQSEEVQSEERQSEENYLVALALREVKT